MWTRTLTILGLAAGLLATAPTAQAQFGDLSPVLLLE